jgi:hypothetical protein
MEHHDAYSLAQNAKECANCNRKGTAKHAK